MTPQGQAGAPAPQPGWFSRNWKWVVGVGCLGTLMCCGVFSAAAYFLKDQAEAVVNEAANDAMKEAAKQPANDAPRGAQGDDVDGARVDCGTPGPEGVDCDIKRTSGRTSFQACWDLEITCANGGVMVGHGCGTIAAGEAAGTVNLPVSAFSNQDGCDAPKAGAVQNLTVLTVK
jgi:hypothetical protein